MNQKLSTEIISVFKKINKITGTYKGVIFYLNNKQKIYIKLDNAFAPHALGLNRIEFFKNKIKKSTNIVNFINKNGIKNKYLNSLKKNDRKIIKCKIDSLNEIFNFFKYDKNFLNWKICYNGKFKTHDYDFIININSACLVLKKHTFKNNNASNDFNSCYIESIRNLECFKKEKEEIVFCNDLKIIEIKPIQHNKINMCKSY